jgi:hypothetical protein
MRKIAILALILNCLIFGATRANAQLKVFVDTSAPTVNAPDPGQTAYLASVLLPAETLNAKNRTGDVVVSGMMENGFYEDQTPTLLINLCDVPSCTGAIVVAVAQVTVGQPDFGPFSWRASARLTTLTTGTAATLTSDTEATMTAGPNCYYSYTCFHSVNVTAVSPAVNLTKALYLVVAWTNEQQMPQVGSPVIATNLLRFVIY